MKKIIISFFIGLCLGSILCFCVLTSINSYYSIEYARKYGLPEIIYYVSQPIGVLGTFLAVFVALFGNEIKNKLFAPRCTVSIIEDGFTEELGTTSSSTSPEAQLYKCTLLFENTGSKELSDMQLIIKEISYSEDKKKYKKISRSIEPILYWTQPEVKKSILEKLKKRK